MATDLDEPYVLRDWKAEILGTVERLLTKTLVSSGCGEYSASRDVDGNIRLSRAAAITLAADLRATRLRLDAAVGLLREVDEFDAGNDPRSWGGVSGEKVRRFKQRLAAFLADPKESLWAVPPFPITFAG